MYAKKKWEDYGSVLEKDNRESECVIERERVTNDGKSCFMILYESVTNVSEKNIAIGRGKGDDMRVYNITALLIEAWI